MKPDVSNILFDELRYGFALKRNNFHACFELIISVDP